MENVPAGHRFKNIQRIPLAENKEIISMVNENLEQCPHLYELIQCYTTDWIKDEKKYGQYESISVPVFVNQIFEGPDTDIENELMLGYARCSGKTDDADGVTPNIIGRHICGSCTSQHFGDSPLPAYEPAFNWMDEHSMIFGQRTSESHSESALKIRVNVLSLSFGAGLVEPFYGTISLYCKDRREKLSEDFYFCVLPAEMQDAKACAVRHAVFTLDAVSVSTCLLIQLEKTATEEGGVASSVYSRKDPVELTERERHRLHIWSQIMPYREAFAWAVVPLFPILGSAAGVGATFPSCPVPADILGSSSQDDNVDMPGNIIMNEKFSQYSSQKPFLLEITSLSRVKECYTEELLQDPKAKVHKLVKGTLKLEIEQLAAHELYIDDTSNIDGQGFDNFRRSDIEMEADRHMTNVSVEAKLGHKVFNAFDFHTMTRSEPFSHLTHCLYVYPLTVSLSRKRNLFIRVELRKDDLDVNGPPLEAVYSRDPGARFQQWADTQVAAGMRLACYHDEIKICLPALLTTKLHLFFTLFHIDLHAKYEAPKPVVIGYAAMQLSVHMQLYSEISLPIMKDLVASYLQEDCKEVLNYLEDGKNIFRLCLRVCSSLLPTNVLIKSFFLEYDRHSIHRNAPWGSELLEAINSLKNVDSAALLQFLPPLLNMLLHLIGDNGEALQVASFRAMVNIITRIQHESSDGAERNHFLLHYVDFCFNEFGGLQSPLYVGLCTVWGSLARSKAKGYRVGPVYDDVLAMAWFFFELIVRSMALEQSHLFRNGFSGDDIPSVELKQNIFKSIIHLFECLLTEVHERSKRSLGLAKRLNSTLAFFCYDLLSVVEPHQVFELVSLYLDKFSGICQSILHECKLTFLQIICDHDLFVEMPGRDPSERNYLASVVVQELFLTLDHDDLSQRTRAARLLVVLMCKLEFDARYQRVDDKLYISQLLFPLVGQILDEMPVFYNLASVEKREVLVVIMQILRNLNDTSLVKAWQQSIARTRLFFKLLEESLSHFEHRKPADIMLKGCSSRSNDEESPVSPKFSERLSPAINSYLSDISLHEAQCQETPDNNYLWHKLSPYACSPSQPYSLREALAQAQCSRIGASTRAMRESLHPILRQKLELWEENLSASIALQVLEITDKFSVAAASHGVATDYGKLDCVTSIFLKFFSHSQPLTFWKAFVPVFNNVFCLHGATLVARENDRFLKQLTFHLLRLAVFRNESVRISAVVGLQLLVRSFFAHVMHTTRLRVMLTIALSELTSDVQVIQMKPDGSIEESGEARRLRKSLKDMADESKSSDLLQKCGLPGNTLLILLDDSPVANWSWAEVKLLSESLILALDAGLEHALKGPATTVDRYAAAESFYKLAVAYAPVPDLHIMWLLHLCDAHQEMQSWAEAAQCAVAVAGVIMQALVERGDAIWTSHHVTTLKKICPMVNTAIIVEASSVEIEGYGASKLTVDSALKYLQLANNLFSQAELYHFCTSISELMIPVYKSKRAFGQLAKCHTSLTHIYESILEQESSPIPFTDATYYRVGFYGSHFGLLDRKEYVYREPRDVRLGDIMKKLSHIHESQIGSNITLHMIPDSRQVNTEELVEGLCYLQITAVDPVTEGEDLDSRRERIISFSAGSTRAPVFNRFLFDTPFTKNGQTQGGLEDQWKRRTVLYAEGSFPAMVNRLLVLKSESHEFSPIENAIGMIETRTAALRNELEEPRAEGDQFPRLQSLQRILQGSVAVQVNSGVLSVCAAFLSGEPAARLQSQELQQLITALLEFMAVCKRAIRVHFRLIGEQDQDFHTQLVNGFQSLTAELSHYIPAILSEL